MVTTLTDKNFISRKKTHAIFVKKNKSEFQLFKHSIYNIHVRFPKYKRINLILFVNIGVVHIRI